MKTKKSETQKTLTLRLPESLLLKVKERALENQRSLNAEIIFVLQQSTKKG